MLVSRARDMADNSEVVNQAYREGLGALFSRDYYKAVYSKTIQYSKVFDYSIGLGSAMSGGSGLGILANPNFAWVCAILTTISVLLSVAKGVWDWPGKAKFALERVQFYDECYSGYQSLIDDINVAKEWTLEIAKRRIDLRQKNTSSTPDPYPELSKKAQREIQNSIKSRINYTSWWDWRPSK
jgi:hypothetical protein